MRTGKLNIGYIGMRLDLSYLTLTCTCIPFKSERYYISTTCASKFVDDVA